MIEALEPDLTRYDTLAVRPPAGAERGETTIALSKETTDGDAEAFAMPEEVFGVRRV